MAKKQKKKAVKEKEVIKIEPIKVVPEEEAPRMEETTMSDITSTEEAIAKVTQLLANEDKRSMISRVNDAEIKACATELVLSEVFGDKVSKEYVKNFLLLRISQGGEGRKEIIDVTKGYQQRVQESLRNKFMRFVGQQPL